MSIHLGLIVEDSDDLNVFKAILSKLVQQNQFKISKFLGKGCGKIKSKSTAWADNLTIKGCTHIILIHDLDRENKEKLHTLLVDKLAKSKSSNYLIVIPKEEVEAWLLSDSAAINDVFGLQNKFPEITHPETIKSPKEYLGSLVYKLEKKRYLHTQHNPKIAASLEVRKLEKCPSFSPLKEFILDIFPIEYHI